VLQPGVSPSNSEERHEGCTKDLDAPAQASDTQRSHFRACRLVHSGQPRDSTCTAIDVRTFTTTCRCVGPPVDSDLTFVRAAPCEAAADYAPTCFTSVPAALLSVVKRNKVGGVSRDLLVTKCAGSTFTQVKGNRRGSPSIPLALV
jgi:hypothetical protein